MAMQPIILRIDDRLIHGQVLVGWGAYYPIKHLVVGNDRIAQNEWERNLLLMAAPSEVDSRVLTLEETLAYIHERLNAPDVSMVLVESPADVQEMADKGLMLKQVNVGGIHFGENRSEYLNYLFLNPEEVELFERLIERGFTFECQDVPTGPRHDLKKILEKRK